MSASSNRSTRSTDCTIVGASNELSLTELPTNKDLLAYRNLLQERGVTDVQLVHDVATRVIQVYRRVGTDVPLIHCKSIESKVRQLFRTYEDANNKSNRKKCAKEVLQRLNKKLDMVFEVVYCCCEITPPL